MRLPRRALLCAIAAAAVLLIDARGASATQYFVKPGENLRSRPPALRPGDEVILWPGRHKSLRFESIAGTAEQPIVIRGLDPRNPPSIEAERFGVQLVGVRHVRLEHLQIDGGSISAIRIEPDDAGVRNAGIELRDVTLGPTTPKDTRHALDVRATDGLRVERLKAERWGGYAVSLVDVHDATLHELRLAGRAEHVQAGAIRMERCERVRIERVRIEDWHRWAISAAAVRQLAMSECAILGTNGPNQFGGIRLEGGSQDVEITACLVRDAGDDAVCIGGATEAGDALPLHPVGAPAEEALRFEAARVMVGHCSLIGGRNAIAFSHALSCRVYASTVATPHDHVLSLRSERAGGPPSAELVVSQCLVTISPDTLRSLVHLGRGLDPSALRAEENLWWAGSRVDEHGSVVAAPMPDLPFTLVFPQITGVDPQLGADLRPASDVARDFGAGAVPDLPDGFDDDGIP